MKRVVSHAPKRSPRQLPSCTFHRRPIAKIKPKRLVLEGKVVDFGLVFERVRTEDMGGRLFIILER
jgi:hypothetical protein